MSIQQVTNGSSYPVTMEKSTNTKKSQTTAKEVKETEEVAVVYEKAENSQDKKIYRRDSKTIEKLKQDAEERTRHLRDLVEKMMLKQGQKITESTDIYGFLREGNYEVDEETRMQAQKDIAEDGYWGVKQTSERLVSFAMALSGGDPSKADTLIEAVKKGFEEATKAWGGELPSICKETVEVTIKKLEEWRDSINQ